jgi:phosphoribosylaminoimidazole (AIR) synthetase
MVVCVAEKDKDAAIQCLTTSGETAWEIGKVEVRQDGNELVRFI